MISLYDSNNEAAKRKDNDEPNPPPIVTLSAVENAIYVLLRYVIKISIVRDDYINY